MDGTPVLSQVKSFFQWVTGNSKGAEETQKNFIKTCPVVSQVTSLVQAISGDAEGAKETQIQFLKGVSGMVDSIPVAGHVKGVVHYACGDKEGGDNAMKAASRSTLVYGGGVGGFLVGGPAGAAIAGTYAGLVMDGIITVADKAVNGEKGKPHGLFDHLSRIAENPTDGGNYVDLIGTTVLDGIAGYTAGNGLGKKTKHYIDKKKLANAVGDENAKMIVDAGETMRKTRSSKKIKCKTPHVMTEAKDAVTGKKARGVNRQMRAPLQETEHIQNGPTELQKRVPGAKQKLNRPAHACAEQQALNQIYLERPEAKSNEITCISLKWNHELQQPVTIPRCGNCLEFGEAMGFVPTDLIPETPIPLKVSATIDTAVGACILYKTLKDETDDESEDESDDKYKNK